MNITGKISLTENNIKINDKLINLEDIKKIYLKAHSIRGITRGSIGTNNKIEIKTAIRTFAQNFIIENKEQKEHLKNYLLFLKAENVLVYIEGIDLR
nr:hypothetical protein [Flavobacterium sp. ASV13]